MAVLDSARSQNRCWNVFRQAFFGNCLQMKSRSLSDLTQSVFKGPWALKRRLPPPTIHVRRCRGSALALRLDAGTSCGKPSIYSCITRKLRTKTLIHRRSPPWTAPESRASMASEWSQWMLMGPERARLPIAMTMGARIELAR